MSYEIQDPCTSPKHRALLGRSTILPFSRQEFFLERVVCVLKTPPLLVKATKRPVRPSVLEEQGDESFSHRSKVELVTRPRVHCRSPSNLLPYPGSKDSQCTCAMALLHARVRSSMKLLGPVGLVAVCATRP